MGVESELRKQYGLPDRESGVERRSDLFPKQQQRATNPVIKHSLREIRQQQIDAQKAAEQSRTSPHLTDAND